MAEPQRMILESLDPGTTFRVGDWEVEPRALLLRARDREHRLEPRVMALLVCLAESAGRAVTRDELLARVWHDVVVGDDAVHSAISKLRRALGNGNGDPRNERTIATVPKIGYRLVAPVDWPRRTPGSSGEERPTPAPAEAPATLEAQPEPPWTARSLLWALPALVILGGALFWTLGSGGGKPVAARPDVRPVTSWTGLEVEPAFAPGGVENRVAFAWKGPAGDNWDVWVQVPGAGDPLRLTRHPGSDHYPAWSPDGRHVAFLRYENGECSVLQVPSLGGAERRITSCGHAEGLIWSPDGERLFWAERPDPEAPFRIVELSLAGLGRREITLPAPGSVGDLAPAVSPDGKTLAFLRSPVLGVEDLFLQPIAGGEPRRLTRDSLKIHGADWMPDGRSLVFSSNRGGLFSLWRIGIDGGEPVWLGVSGGNLDAPSVGRSGRRVAYEQWNDDTNVYRMPLAAGAEPEKVLGSTRWDWSPHASGDDGRVVFVSDRTGSSELWVRPIQGPAPARQLTSFGGPYVNHPRRSPDGSEIAFDARPGGNVDVYVLREGDQLPRNLSDHPAQDMAPTWSSDGRSLYFASDRGGTWEIWRTPAGSNAPTRVTRGGGAFAQELPGGLWLYFTRRHEPGIWRMPLEGEGEAERIVDDLAPLDRFHWILTEDALLYLRRPRFDRPVLTRLDLATGRAEELGDLGPIPHNSGLSLDPGGEAVLFTGVDRMESDILVLELGS